MVSRPWERSNTKLWPTAKTSPARPSTTTSRPSYDSGCWRSWASETPVAPCWAERRGGDRLLGQPRDAAGGGLPDPRPRAGYRVRRGGGAGRRLRGRLCRRGRDGRRRDDQLEMRGLRARGRRGRRRWSGAGRARACASVRRRGVRLAAGALLGAHEPVRPLGLGPLETGVAVRRVGLLRLGDGHGGSPTAWAGVWRSGKASAARAPGLAPPGGG